MSQTFPLPAGFAGPHAPLLVFRTPRTGGTKPRDDQPTIRIAAAAASRMRAAAQAREATGFAATLRAMLSAIQTRRTLARLDDRMLSDIGASRADALAEAARWPWDLRIDGLR